MNTFYKYKLTLIALLTACVAFAGNPDRQGEAGAAELLLNPWARSAGLHTMNTSTITGIESMRLNIAGLSRLSGKELVLANTRLYEGSDVKMNALGYGNKVGTNGAFGITLTAMDFGDIPITTTTSPEGTGGVFSPSFFNIGLGYSYMYDNKISVGLLVRGVAESLSNVSAFGFAVDAGVQYVAGTRDAFKLGISLRNVGSSMSFAGEGLAFQADPGNGEAITFSQRAAEFEMPSMLNIGVSYDFYFGNRTDAEGTVLSQNVMVRALANFTSNAFSRDQLGAGIEVVFGGKFTLRGAYKQELGTVGNIKQNLYSGLAGGASVELPFNDSGSRRIGLDYAYRATNPFKGTHNLSIRLLF